MSREECDTQDRRWSVGVRDVETREWTEVVVSASDRETAATKAKDNSRGILGPFNRQTALETDIEEIDD